jgi:hypothetical protein
VMLTRSGRPAHVAVRLCTGLNAATVSVSADARRLAYATFTRTANVWSIPISPHGSISASVAKPVTTGSQEIEGFDLSADGRWLAFDSNRGGIQQLYRMPLGGGDVEQLTAGDVPSLAPAFSPNGREIAFHRFVKGIRQIFVMPVEGGTAVQVTAGSTHSRIANWSPDGRALSFVKNALSPTQETAIVRRDGNGHWGSPRTLVKGGAAGLWAQDGRGVLTVMRADGDRVALLIASPAGGAPRTVVPPHDRVESAGYSWGFSPDGRFVYYLGRDRDKQKSGIWGVPSGGGARRLMVGFDDPASGLNRAALRVHGNRFYFTLGDPESDVWMTEVTGSR